ncbi:Mitochondrial inner membrane protein OXA1 [Golovinomyces cichoracearum]|uniref:Mitochondrial inner membrane protein OXA1 n=1 Tax=Golovinomyces cichoracearum TaxID=62708 RepID=A0A420HNM3_9PEZI|nr:Mitochondrial inner membrane protein OXA1 [Golovinomyces cichoracearum]
MMSSSGLYRSSLIFHFSRRRLELGSIKHFSSVRHSAARCKTESIFSSAFDHISRSKSKSFRVFRNRALPGIGVSRFASTTSTTPSTSKSALGASVVEGQDDISALPLSVINLDEDVSASVEELLNAPEKIGYLKSIGLDWGWGPTSIMEYVLEHIHVYTGAPWWVSITLTAILVRVILFRPYVASAENATRMAIVNPISKPVIDKMMAAQRAKDQAAFFQYKQEQSLIYKRAGINPWKSGIPFIQMILGFGTFRLLNGMAKLPVPGLETGGTLWFTNLTIPDPYFILPLATSATLHWVMRKGGETGIQTMNPKMLVVMTWGLPLISVIFTSWLPAGVQLTFFVSGILSLSQASLLRQPWLRSYFEMTPLPTSNSVKSSDVASSIKTSSRVVENRVLTQAELAQRFQPPDPEITGQSGGSASIDPTLKAKIREVFAGALSDIKGTVKEVAETGRNFAGQSKEEVKGRLAKAEIRQRELYEKKKREEEIQARFEEQRLRNLERKKRKRQQ